ncbi:MAG TPA: hypothetical protein VLC52_00310 [Anaerolineae bacterium]|nr:hypothetical protein [Anaerolineae bacterium]
MFHPTLLYELTKERQAELARMARLASQRKAAKQARRPTERKQ